MLCNKQPQTSVVYTDKHVFLTHTSVGRWWWFCWAQLGLPMLDFTPLLNSVLSHVAPSLGISCYLAYVLLMATERYISKPTHAGVFNISVGSH